MIEKDGLVYCNDGDWVENCTALLEDASGELRLLRGIGAVVAAVDLAEVAHAFFRRLLFRVAPRNLEKLQWMLCHYAACLND